MSINYNGASATDGLVFAYDLGNVRSYKGVPSKNVARPLTQWVTKARATITEVTDNSVEPPFKGAQVFKVVCNSDTNSILIRDGGYYYRHPWNDLNSYYNQGLLADQENQITSVGQNKYRYVVYAKRAPNSNPNATVSIDIGDRNVVNSGVLGDDWVRIETSDAQGINAAHYPYDFFDIVLSPTEIGNEVYISSVMIITSPNDSFETLTTPPAFPQYLDYGEERGYDESLLNLTGDNPIDLSNQSFDSNAQMTFDGTGDKIDTSISSNNWPEKAFTLEGVVKYESLSNHSWFELQRNTDSAGLVSVVRNNNFYFYWVEKSGNSGHSIESPLIQPNQYIHIVLTFNGVGGSNRDVLYDNTLTYLNGELTPHVPKGGAAISSGGKLFAGSQQYPMNGELPIFKFYDRVLTAEEVAQNFNSLKNRFDL